jgi:hypothetical protein
MIRRAREKDEVGRQCPAFVPAHRLHRTERPDGAPFQNLTNCLARYLGRYQRMLIARNQ